MATSKENELARYHTVIHLRVPDVDQGYQKNLIRIESAEQAAAVDRLIAAAWVSHPRQSRIGGRDRLRIQSPQRPGGDPRVASTLLSPAQPRHPRIARPTKVTLNPRRRSVSAGTRHPVGWGRTCRPG